MWSAGIARTFELLDEDVEITFLQKTGMRLRKVRRWQL